MDVSLLQISVSSLNFDNKKRAIVCLSRLFQQLRLFHTYAIRLPPIYTHKARHCQNKITCQLCQNEQLPAIVMYIRVYLIVIAVGHCHD